MYVNLFLLLLLVQHAVYLGYFALTANQETDLIVKHAIAKFFMDHGRPFKKIRVAGMRLPAKTIVADQEIRDIIRLEKNRLTRDYLKLFIGVFLFYPVMLFAFRKRSFKETGKRYIRGAKLDTNEDFFKKAEENKDRLRMPLGTLVQPWDAEPKHMIMIGGPGSGKTVALCPIIDKQAQDGEKGIILDLKLDYTSKFYNPERDLIFNPVDPRSLKWSIFNDIVSELDIETYGNSLIPKPIFARESPIWTDGARAVFTSSLHNLYHSGKTKNSDIWETILEESDLLADNLKRTKEGKIGHRFIENFDSNKAQGILSSLMQYCKCFKYMGAIDGDFSINEWINNGKPGFIFVTSQLEVKDTLAPIQSLFIEILAKKIASLQDSYTRRIFFDLDEFTKLQRLDAIVDLVTFMRSKGACCYLASQDYGQIDDKYGVTGRQTLISGCGTQVYFKVGEEAAKITANNINEIEYMEAVNSDTIGDRGTINIKQEKFRELLFLPSDISNLKKLRAVVKFPEYNYMMSEFKWVPYPDVAEPFILRDDLILKNMYKS